MDDESDDVDVALSGSELKDPYQDAKRREEEEEPEEEDEEGQEEEEEREEEVEYIEEEEEIEVEVVYNSAEYVSKPYLSENCTLPDTILEFEYSYGYDCKRLFNLSVIDKDTLIYASGNIIHFLNARTGQKWYRRCYSGRGIGHITTNPVFPHVAVGEKGENPNIIIYDWPAFEIVTILERGTKREYTHLNYSPDGEFLCSQGGYPDHMLTVWNWRKHRIMLRAKAYGEKVFNSMFSLYVPGHLTSSGISHIKFWKINRTFTGLKLQGELGRFGKTEICNIMGFLALPDEKVVSGSEWGNILVWDAGLIRVEVFRRGKNSCHEAPITQFIYNNGELITVAMDGTIKIWYYETIELADPPEEDRYIEVEPIFEFEVGDYYHKAELMVIVKSDPDPNDTVWFGQDGNGGIWKLDLSTALNSEPPHQIYQCHAGHVVAVQVSPAGPHFATLGADGRLLIYNYKTRQMLAKKEFLPGGTCLLWLPLTVESSGSIILGGFDDGVIRVICASMRELENKHRSPTEEYINLVQVTKPHSRAITMITVNPTGQIIVTGSEDCTVFVYKILNHSQFIQLTPIGFVEVSGSVSCHSWNPKADATILIGCSNGSFMEIEPPLEPESEDPVSYKLENVKMQKSNFVSVKGSIRRNQKIEQIMEERRILAEQRRKEAEEEGKTAELEEEEEEEIDEEQLPEAYVPPVPNPILLAMYTPSGKIWLSVGGYDAGYMYEYEFNTKGPVLSKMVDDADDIEIHCCEYYHNERYLIMGMHDGQIRVVRVNEEDESDLSDYWSYSMHDNDNGIIHQICFSNNYKYMFSCGSDGNVFCYKFNPENNDFKLPGAGKATSKGFPDTICTDLDDPKAPSLEYMKVKIENEHQLKIANLHKRDILDMLKVLEKKYESLLRHNAKLPKSQQLTKEELILDMRIVNDLETSLVEEMDLLKRKLAWHLEKSHCLFEKLREYYVNGVEIQTLKVRGVDLKDRYVETFRLKALGSEFEETKKLVAIKLEEQELKGRAQARIFSEEEVIEVITRRPNPAEGLLKQILALCRDYKKNIKLRRLLRKYRERKERLETRRIEWHEMMARKPNPDKPDPEDLEAIKLAQEFIGDYKLKTAADYKVPTTSKITTVGMYDKLLRIREQIYSLQKEFNVKVLNLRQRKLDMIERHQQFRLTLQEIAKEIPKEKIHDPPELPSYNEDEEFPEKKFFYTENDVFDELPKRHKNLYRTTMTKKKEIKMMDKEHEMLITEKTLLKSAKIESKMKVMKFAEPMGSKVVKDLEALGQDDQVFTPWEKEFKKMRVLKRLYDQHCIIEEMESDIRNYDEDVLELHKSRIKIEVDVKLLEIYLITLHQEVLILKKFEAAEEEKENKLFEKMLEKHEMQKKMNEINSRIESRFREIRRCEEEIKNMVSSYYAGIADNKFYDFLRRIFKKKYRPPKVKTDDSDSESESESSSSSDEEDAKSLDSKDIGPIRLDENVCPPGCDPMLYEWTFEQRSARHALELTIADEKKLIEAHRKEYEVLSKKIKTVEVQYLSCQEDLEEYMREKQRNLNEVETVVVLHMNQIQNLKNEEEMEKLNDSVLFSSERLTNLYRRVGELEKETNVEKQKHAKNCQHLARMKIDIKHMKNVIRNLTKEIDDAMMKKFGSKIDIDDIEESLLKRMVADMHTIVLDLERQFENQLRSLRDKLKEREETYAMRLQENTERNNLLAVLEEEKINLQKEFEKQKNTICGELNNEEEEKKELKKLEKVVRDQDEKICALKAEIQLLRMKPTPMPPIIGMYATEVEEVVQKLMIRSFEGECGEITMDVRNELKDIYEEAQEIAHDMRDGVMDKADESRMRQLTEDFIEKLPGTVQTSVIQRLSDRNLVKPGTAEKCRRESAFLRELVRAIPAEYFLQVFDMVGEIMETISTSIEGGQIKF